MSRYQDVKIHAFISTPLSEPKEKRNISHRLIDTSILEFFSSNSIAMRNKAPGLAV